ncbi:ABC transporter substrate-binding protein [Catenulispora pinisilvae]|uniref:ABC transporter substrate-binding protein n=1 Tax=Catenulispora pinisilvae TaxID=2705253 RepID=UPI001891DE52|nr:ABC transporter substrate-binding protein [Catenulispora pinisilvae]
MSAFAATACSSSTSSGASMPSHGSLEQTQLRIGIPKGDIGALPIYTGFDKGYFKDQGVDVSIDDSYGSYQDALSALNAGKVDLVYDDYVHAILAQSTGAYRLQLVAEGYTAGDGSVQLVGKPTPTNVKSADQIKNVFNASGGFLVPTAGTNDANDAYTVPTIMLMTSLPDLANSLRIKADNSASHLKSLPAGGVVDKLTSGTDANRAAVLAEPYYSVAMNNNQLINLLDLTRGSTQAMPMGGYFAKQDFAVTHPNLFKAFTGALNQAKDVTSQRATAMSEMQAHYGTMASSTVAASLSFGTFPTTVNVDRVSRVLTLMQSLDLAPYYNIDTMMPPDALRSGS